MHSIAMCDFLVSISPSHWIWRQHSSSRVEYFIDQETSFAFLAISLLRMCRSRSKRQYFYFRSEICCQHRFQ